MLRKIFYRFFLVVAGLFVGALGVEAVLQVVLPPPQFVRVSENSAFEQRLQNENKEPKKLQLQKSVLDGGTLYFSTPTGFRLRANTTAVIENHHCGGQTVTVRTNALGHRGPDLGKKKIPRVLFIGDSITVQDYLEYEETWVQRIEQLAREQNQPLEAINAGVGAIGMANELAIFKETGLSVQPDIVVLGWYLNDFQSSPGVQILNVPWYLKKLRIAHLVFKLLAQQSPEEFRIDEQVVTAKTVRAWYDEAHNQFPSKKGDYRTNREAFNGLLLEWFYDWGTGWSNMAWDYLRPQFEEFKRLAQLHGIQPLIVVFPVMPQIEAEFVHDFPQQRVREIANSLDIPMLDLLPVMRNAYRENTTELLYYDQCHPTGYGSKIVAQNIYNFLKQYIPSH